MNHNHSQKLNLFSFDFSENKPVAWDLDFDGFGAGFSFLEAGGCLVFTLLVTFPFFVLLAFFTLNSSSSLSDSSLKSSSLSESEREKNLMFY